MKKTDKKRRTAKKKAPPKKKAAKKKRSAKKRKALIKGPEITGEIGAEIAELFGPVVVNPNNGREVQLPALQDYVEELLPFNKRRDILRKVMPAYGVARITVDRAIAKAKKAIQDQVEESRESRVNKSFAQITTMINEARAGRDYGAVARLIKLRHELAGDIKQGEPKVLVFNQVLNQMGNDYGQVAQAAERMRASAIRAEQRAADSRLLPAPAAGDDAESKGTAGPRVVDGGRVVYPGKS